MAEPTKEKWLKIASFDANTNRTIVDVEYRDKSGSGGQMKILQAILSGVWFGLKYLIGVAKPQPYVYGGRCVYRDCQNPSVGRCLCREHRYLSS